MYLENASKDTICAVAISDTPGIIRGVKNWRIKVRDELTARHLTQEALEPILGVKRAMVGHMLAGRRRMKLEQMDALLKFLGLKFEDLFDDEPAIDPLRVSKLIHSLPTQERRYVQAFADALAQTLPWDRKTDRRVNPGNVVTLLPRR